jgi:hypothetical protein
MSPCWMLRVALRWPQRASGSVPVPGLSARFLSDDQLADSQPWFDNHRRLRELITELEALSQAIADADPRWNRRTRPPGRTRQTRS